MITTRRLVSVLLVTICIALLGLISAVGTEVAATHLQYTSAERRNTNTDIVIRLGLSADLVILAGALIFQAWNSNRSKEINIAVAAQRWRHLVLLATACIALLGSVFVATSLRLSSAQALGVTGLVVSAVSTGLTTAISIRLIQIRRKHRQGPIN